MVEDRYETCWNCGTEDHGKRRVGPYDEEPVSAEIQSSAPIDQLVFVGFHSQVIALDRESGDRVWHWKCPRGSGFVGILLDGDRLIVSVMGYMYCLDPETGAERWHNHLEGTGTGAPCLASLRGGGSIQSIPGIAAKKQQDDAAAAAGAGS